MRPVTTRTTGVVLLALLLAGFLLLGALPEPGATIRLGGLSLLWWYGGVVAPVLAVLVASAGSPSRCPARLRANDLGTRILAVWLTPAVLLAVPAALAARGPDGLWLGLVLTLAPLIALGVGHRPPLPGAARRARRHALPGRPSAPRGRRAPLGQHRAGG